MPLLACLPHRLAGLNLNNMNKMLKCAGNDDVITMKADETADVVSFVFESPGAHVLVLQAGWAAACCAEYGLMQAVRHGWCIA